MATLVTKFQVAYAVSGTGEGVPGGLNSYVQYNDSSDFGGDSGFTYNKVTHVLSVSGYFAGALTGNVTGDVSGSSSSCTGNAATVSNAIFTTAFTNQGGAGVLVWPAAGATLTVPIGGGTLDTGAFSPVYVLPIATDSLLGGVKPDNASVLVDSAGVISATAASVGALAVVTTDATLTGAGTAASPLKAVSSGSGLTISPPATSVVNTDYPNSTVNNLSLRRRSAASRTYSARSFT